MKAVGSKTVNDLLKSKRCSRHDVKAGRKNASRAKQKAHAQKYHY